MSMRQFSGTSIEITYPNANVYIREKKGNYFEIERKSEDVDFVKINDIEYQFYKDKIKVDFTDFFAAKIGSHTINVAAGFDDEDFSFTSHDSFYPDADILVFPSDMIVFQNMKVCFKVNGKLNRTEDYYTFQHVDFFYKNTETEITLYGDKNYFYSGAATFKTTKDYCGHVEIVRWRTQFGNTKEFVFFVESIVEGSDENLELINDFDGYDIRKNRFTDYNLILPKCDYQNHHYLSDLFYSDKVELGDNKGVLVDISEFELPTDKATFKPKDLRFKVRVKKYDL